MSKLTLLRYTPPYLEILSVPSPPPGSTAHCTSTIALTSCVLEPIRLWAGVVFVWFTVNYELCLGIMVAPPQQPYWVNGWMKKWMSAHFTRFIPSETQITSWGIPHPYPLTHHPSELHFLLQWHTHHTLWSHSLLLVGAHDTPLETQDYCEQLPGFPWG